MPSPRNDLNKNRVILWWSQIQKQFSKCQPSKVRKGTPLKEEESVLKRVLHCVSASVSFSTWVPLGQMCAWQAHHGNTVLTLYVSSGVTQKYLPKPHHSITYNRSPFHRHLPTFSTNLFSISFPVPFLCLQDVQCEKQGGGPSVRQNQEAQVEGRWTYIAQSPFCNPSQVHTEYIFSWA